MSDQMGHIVGGWEYIWGAYGVAWGGLSLYALSLWLRRSRPSSPPSSFGSAGPRE